MRDEQKRRVYRIAHREEIKNYNARYKQEHKNELKKKRKAYTKKNAASVRNYNLKYKLEHKKEEKEYRKRYEFEHRSDIRKQRKAYQKKNKEVIKTYPSNAPENRMATHRKYAYGLTHERFLEKRKTQNDRCAICGLQFYVECGSPCVDHSHETEEIRDLLCQNCNRGLGLFKEDPIRLGNAIQYLRKHKDKQ
jgi:hypothetical protein